MTTYPKIIIRHGWLLEPVFTAAAKSKPGNENIEVPTEEFVEAQILRYKTLWTPYEAKILKAICDIIGFNYSRNEIDVFVVALNHRSMSRPLIVKCRLSDMDFINTLTHELIHCNYSDNDASIRGAFKVKHANETTNNHVTLHAILKMIYLDILKEPERLAADIAFCKSPAYADSWKIVQEGDYKKIIADFKSRIKQ